MNAKHIEHSKNLTTRKKLPKLMLQNSQELLKKGKYGMTRKTKQKETAHLICKMKRRGGFRDTQKKFLLT